MAPYDGKPDWNQMNTLIVILAVACIIYFRYETVTMGLLHRTLPTDIKADDQMINMGVIPHRLAMVIPVDFELREDWTMRSRVEPIFVDGRKRPLWSIVITLKDSICETETVVLYNLDGTLFEY